MPLGAEETAVVVRLTARVSAAVFAASLVAAARRLASGEPAARAARRADIAAFGAFLGAHTIHFAAVLMLAAATSGANIRSAGGWVPTLAVAAAFYAACGAVLAGKLRTTARWTTAAGRRLDVATTGIVWIVFFQAYALRLLQSAWFTALAAALAASLALYAAAAASGKASRSKYAESHG